MDIAKDNQRIAVNTIILYIRMLFMMGISLYTSRVVLDVLGIDDYGIYNVVGGIVAVFSFISGTMSFTTQRFLTFSLGLGDIGKTHKVFCTSVNIHLIISAIILLFAETIGLWFLNTQMSIPAERLNASNWVYQCSIISAIILFVSMPYNGVIVAHERMSAFAYISIFEAALRLALVYLLTLIEFDKLILYSILMLAVQLIIRVIYGSYCKRHFSECKYYPYFDKSIFKEMFKFAGWSLYGGMASVSASQGLNILLNIFFNPAVNAAYAIAQQVYGAVQNFVNNFLTAIRPQITKSYASNDYKRMHELVLTSTRYSYFMTFALVFPILLEIIPILSLWLKDVPNYTANFVRWILCISLIDVLANPLITATNATGNIAKYQKIIGSMQLLIIPVSYIALKLVDYPPIVLICQFVLMLVVQFCRLWIVRPIIKLPILSYIKSVLAPVILVTVVACVLPIIVWTKCNSGTFINFIIVCSITLISTLLSIWFLGINKNEKIIIRNKLQSLIRKY